MFSYICINLAIFILYFSKGKYIHLFFWFSICLAGIFCELSRQIASSSKLFKFELFQSFHKIFPNSSWKASLEFHKSFTFSLHFKALKIWLGSTLSPFLISWRKLLIKCFEAFFSFNKIKAYFRDSTHDQPRLFFYGNFKNSWRVSVYRKMIWLRF